MGMDMYSLYSEANTKGDNVIYNRGTGINSTHVANMEHGTQKWCGIWT